MKSQDDSRRPPVGLLFTAFEDTDGTIRFIMDEVERCDESGKTWKHRTFVTHENFPRDVFMSGSFSNEHLESFGHGLMASLRSLLARRK